MKIIKKCEDNALSKGCLPKYSDYVPAGSGCAGYSEQAFNVTNTVYVLANGSILIPYNNNHMPLFAFDINGKKGPNKPGFDLFSLNISQTKKGTHRLHAGGIVGCLPSLPGRFTYEEIFE